MPVIANILSIGTGGAGAFEQQTELVVLLLVITLLVVVIQRDLLAGIVYGVVLVTLLGQGLGLYVLLPRWSRKNADSPTP